MRWLLFHINLGNRRPVGRQMPQQICHTKASSSEIATGITGNMLLVLGLLGMQMQSGSGHNRSIIRYRPSYSSHDSSLTNWVVMDWRSVEPASKTIPVSYHVGLHFSLIAAQFYSFKINPIYPPHAT